MKTGNERASLYDEVTARVIAELEAGRLPWVQPWDAASCGCTMPANAATGRRYSGIFPMVPEIRRYLRIFGQAGRLQPAVAV